MIKYGRFVLSRSVNFSSYTKLRGCLGPSSVPFAMSLCMSGQNLPSANQGDSENGLQSPQLMAIGHTCYDGPGILQVKSQCNICDHKASSDLQFTMQFMIGYNLVSDSNLS